LSTTQQIHVQKNPKGFCRKVEARDFGDQAAPTGLVEERIELVFGLV
jgi:hypothetical protein